MYRFFNRSVSAIFILSILQLSVFAQIRGDFEVNGRKVDPGELGRQIADVVAKASLPGMSFAIISNGEIVFYDTYGYKEFEHSEEGIATGKEKINKRTVFEACSLSKSFFIFATHRLVDQGLLDLDSPLYKMLRYPKLEHDERYKKITARMVLTHSSGIENWYFDHDPKRLEIVSEPGSKVVYSGEGFVYLSKVVEAILNKDISSYMNDLVFRPLGLKRTYTTFSNDGRKPKNFAFGHDSFLQPANKEKIISPNIACYINTTAYDYAKLLIATFGGKYLSRQRLSDLTQPHIALNDEIYRGLGYSVYCHNGDTVVYQGGNNGPYKGFGFYSLKRKSGYVMFVNGERGDQVQKILDDLTLRQELFEPKNQYPNLESEILKVYNDRGYAAAMDYAEKKLSQRNSDVSNEMLQTIGYLFLEKEPKLSAYIAKEYKERYPESAAAIILHGKANMENLMYPEAISDFEKARVLDNAASGYLDKLISRCQQLIDQKK